MPVCDLNPSQLEACVATQPWVNRENRRELSMHPYGASVLRISKVEMLGLKLNDELGGYYGVEG